MSDYTPEAIEQAFIRIFSVRGNNIGLSRSRPDKRERIRQAIYVNHVMSERFLDSAMNYAEAFQLCFGERLDRRAAARPLPDENPDDLEDSDIYNPEGSAT